MHRARRPHLPSPDRSLRIVGLRRRPVKAPARGAVRNGGCLAAR